MLSPFHSVTFHSIFFGSWLARYAFGIEYTLNRCCWWLVVKVCVCSWVVDFHCADEMKEWLVRELRGWDEMGWVRFLGILYSDMSGNE